MHQLTTSAPVGLPLRLSAGYFARVAAVDLILRRFVAVARRTGDGRSQVVSLGAGMDTAFFRAFSDSAAPTTYFELDFPDVTNKKAGIIRKHELLQKCIAGRHVAASEFVAHRPGQGGAASGHHSASNHHHHGQGASSASSSGAAPATAGISVESGRSSSSSSSSASPASARFGFGSQSQQAQAQLPSSSADGSTGSQNPQNAYDSRYASTANGGVDVHAKMYRCVVIVGLCRRGGI